MNDEGDFYNDGFGWVCRTCEDETSVKATAGGLSRLFGEGETESKIPRLSHTALARWRDRANGVLECPRCGATGLARK